MVAGAFAPAAPRATQRQGGSVLRRASRRGGLRGAAVTRAVAAPAPPPLATGFADVPRPDAAGRFGRYGGKYVPETLIAALSELESEYSKLSVEPAFQARAQMRCAHAA